MPESVVYVEFTYFKASGKYYTSSEWSMPRPLSWHDAIDYIKQTMRNGYLPGLSGGHWEGSVLVQFQESDVPHLITADALYRADA